MIEAPISPTVNFMTAHSPIIWIPGLIAKPWFNFFFPLLVVVECLLLTLANQASLVTLSPPMSQKGIEYATTNP